MTLRVYEQVLTGPLKPTPNKSHYTFNLRDISRIAQGLCIADRRACVQAVDVVRLWVHENQRVFGDRLIDGKDRGWLEQLLADEACKTFELDRPAVFNAERLVFGDFMEGLDAEPRVYRQVPDLKVLVAKVVEFLEEYNGATKKQMPLVMFLDACDHVARITRVLR
jgi:dynein heavy chain